MINTDDPPMGSDWVSGGVEITRERVDAKVCALFAPADRETVLAILDESLPHAPPRVMMAVLMLSGGSMDDLLAAVLEARQDFRDVLCAAEYPRQTRVGWAAWEQLSADDKDRIRGEDRDAYLAWLAAAPAEGTA
jgi:hypothetical protein